MDLSCSKDGGLITVRNAFNHLSRVNSLQHESGVFIDYTADGCTLLKVARSLVT